MFNCEKNINALYLCFEVILVSFQRSDFSDSEHIVDAKLFTIGNVKPSLNLKGQRDKCAGVVEFSTESGTFGVCKTGWSKWTKNYFIFIH